MLAKKTINRGRTVIKKYKGEISREDVVTQLVRLWMSHIKMNSKAQK
mgnify:CR=1 FL=1